MTNREKFTEIFGCEIAQRDTGEAIPGHCKILIASDRHFNDWVQQEYVPSAQPGQRNAIVFQGIVVEYPSISAYPEYEGKPYFSIKYTENGQEFIGYGTYKPEVLSEYLKEYFMSPAQPNLSEAYSKAVFTWLRDYQIRAAELKGRYTPYEVLSWVANDWRKEHERFD